MLSLVGNGKAREPEVRASNPAGVALMYSGQKRSEYIGGK
jgi:hypothetical protein